MTRVLTVDDKEDNLYYLQTLLTGYGCEVETAQHGAEALVKARQNPPDLIISDLLMPVMDGYTLLRHWKADARLKQAPFIVYTATYTESEDEQLALNLGADAFILKPAEPEDFLARIREVQSKAAGSREAEPRTPASDDAGLLKSYSDTLIRKLEEKTLQLEESNKTLQEDIAERQRAHARLRESEKRFRELAENMQEVFYIASPDNSVIHYVSPAFERIWSRTCASLYERPLTWLDSIHPDDRERIQLAVQTKQDRGEYDEIYRIHRPDGTERSIRDRSFPVHGDAGEVLRIVGTAEDITERRQLEEQYCRAQKMEAIGHLAGGVAHDFNNIITAILGNTELALADIGEGNPARRSLEEIKKAGIRATKLVEQILSFSSPQPQQRRVIDLGPTVEEAVGFMRATIPSTVDLVSSIDGDAPAVLADATQVHQVVANLCTNALHALGDNAGRIEVKLAAVDIDAVAATRLAGLRPGRVACLTVTDTGKGMETATVDRIFEPFFTTKERGKGTGLGLSVVHGIVHGHDGAITVSSQPGRGTTFQVCFPAVADTDFAAATPLSVPHPGTGQHILYLDDEEPLVFFATRMLDRLGYQASGFTSPAEAMTAFREAPDEFDLVIVDLTMPGTSGIQVAADMMQVRPDLPVVLCSGHVTDDIRKRARSAGIRDVLHKQNSMEEFSEAIHHLAAKTVNART